MFRVFSRGARRLSQRSRSRAVDVDRRLSHAAELQVINEITRRVHAERPPRAAQA
jgi:hypothetical protein